MYKIANKFKACFVLIAVKYQNMEQYGLIFRFLHWSKPPRLHP